MSDLKTLIEDGFAVTKAALQLNIPRKEAENEVLNNSYKLKREIFNDCKIPEIVDLYNRGVSVKQLALKFRIDKRRIQKWVKETGNLRSISDSIRATFFNESIFDVIDTYEKAYWLGFFYADAYNSDKTNSFNISLNIIDTDHLFKLADFVELPRNKVTISNVKVNEKIFSNCSLKMCSKHICKTLSNHGCPRAKSFIIKYPNWLDEKLHNHFVRGLFDGDGCLTFRKKQKEWKFSIVSTKECCEDICNLIFKNTGKSIRVECISKTNNNTYVLETSGNEKISKILNWIYFDSNESCRLSRKYEKYLKLLEQQHNRKISKLRDNYNIDLLIKKEILESDLSNKELAKKFSINPVTIRRLRKKSNLQNEKL